MDAICSLHTLLACFSLSNLYLDGGLVYEDVRYYEFSTLTQEAVATPRNPLGRAALGYEIRFSNVTIAIEASHTSSLQTNDDRGVNALGLKARWYPFNR